MILKKDVFSEEYDENEDDEDEEEDDENNNKKAKDSDDEAELNFQTNAFDVDAKARVIIYAYGRILKF